MTENAARDPAQQAPLGVQAAIENAEKRAARFQGR